MFGHAGDSLLKKFTQKSPLLRLPVLAFGYVVRLAMLPAPAIDLLILNSNSIMRREQIIPCKRAALLRVRKGEHRRTKCRIRPR